MLGAWMQTSLLVLMTVTVACMAEAEKDQLMLLWTLAVAVLLLHNLRQKSVMRAHTAPPHPPVTRSVTSGPTPGASTRPSKERLLLLCSHLRTTYDSGMGSIKYVDVCLSLFICVCKFVCDNPLAYTVGRALPQSLLQYTAVHHEYVCQVPCCQLSSALSK